MSEPEISETGDIHLGTVSVSPLCLEVYSAPELVADPFYRDWMDRLVGRLVAVWESYRRIAEARGIPEGLGLRAEGQDWEIELTFLNNDRMQVLNGEYRDKDQSTDVLTFTLFADSPMRAQMAQLPTLQLGEIFISLPWALENAGEADSTSGQVFVLDQYVLERVVHGFLHIMGINHDTMEEYNKVVAIQKQVLNEVFTA